MKRLVDLLIMVLLAALFVASLIMGMTGAWWNFGIAGGIMLVGLALYIEMVCEDRED